MMYITHGVGWLALLILAKGQCEGLTTRISAEEILPRFFYFHKLHTNHIAEQGVFRAEPMALARIMSCSVHAPVLAEKGTEK